MSEEKVRDWSKGSRNPETGVLCLLAGGIRPIKLWNLRNHDSASEPVQSSGPSPKKQSSCYAAVIRIYIGSCFIQN